MTWLAADAPPTMPTWVTLLTALAIPICGVLGVILGPAITKRMSRPTDQASVRKAAAETEHEFVGIAKDLLAEVREQNKELRADVKDQGERIDTLEAWQRAVISLMRKHGRWDAKALDMLRAIHNDYPEPPPLEPDDWR